jgi:hypothetical protein
LLIIIQDEDLAMSLPKKIVGGQYQGYPVLAGDQFGPLRQDIVSRGVNMLSHMRNKFQKVLFIRLDFHYPKNLPGVDSNTIFSNFNEELMEFFRHMGIYAKMLWNRESGGKNGRGHHHAVLLLDGHKARSMYGHLEQIEYFWAKALGFSCLQPGLVDFCNHEKSDGFRDNGFMITRDDGEAFAEAVRWMSYLAKADRGDSPKGVRSFGSSRLPKKQNGAG